MTGLFPYLLLLIISSAGAPDPYVVAMDAMADSAPGFETKQVIRPGKEKLLEGLTAPYVSEGVIQNGAVLGDTTITKGIVTIGVLDDSGVVLGHLVLAPPGVLAKPTWVSVHFEMMPTVPMEAMDILAERIIANDVESPWVALEGPSPPAQQTPEAQVYSTPLWRDVLMGTGTVKVVHVMTWVLLLFFSWITRGAWVADLKKAWPWLLGIIVTGAGLRLAMDLTILKEANVFRGFYAMMEPAFGSHVAGDYPQAVEALVSLLQPLLGPVTGGELPEGLFVINIVGGVLMIPAMYVTARVLDVARPWALVAAASVAVSPHLVRYSASETYQILAGLYLVLFMGLMVATVRLVVAPKGDLTKRILAMVVTCSVAFLLANVRPEWPLGVVLVAAFALLTAGPRLGELVTSRRAWLLALGLAVALTPSVVRYLFATDDSTLTLAAGWDLVTGFFSPMRHTLLDPRFTLSLVFLLLLVGPLVAKGLQRWRAVGILAILVPMTFLYMTLLSEIIPMGEARYQVGLAPLWLLGASISLHGIGDRLKSTRGRTILIVGASIAFIAHGCAMAPQLMTILGNPQAEIDFLMAARPEVRSLDAEGCVLVIPENIDGVSDLDPKTGRDVVLWGSLWNTHSVVSATSVLEHPEVVEGKCHLYLQGLFCYRAGGGPPQGLHPQCQSIFDSFSIEPVATTSVANIPYHARLSLNIAADILTFGIYRLGSK